jgi:branched-chain amino acid transport system substrate-binding protein
MRNARRLIALAACLALTVAACSSTGGTTTGEQAADDTASTSTGTLVVGSLASQTGNGAPYGLGQQRGTELAVDLEGGDIPLRIQSADDGSTPDTGSAAMSSLIDLGVACVLGPTLSPVAAAADPLAQSVGVPVLAVTNTTLDIDAIGDLVWRVTLSEKRMIPQGLAAASQLRGVRSAVLVSDASDGYAAGAAAAFRAGAASVGIELIDDVTFEPASLDPAGYAALLSEAVAKRPDALLLAARSTSATNLLLATEGLELPGTVLGGNGFNAPDVLQNAGASADGLAVTASWNPAIDVPASLTFVERYRERFGTDPDAFAAQSYAGVQILVAAARAGGGTSRQAIQAGLRSLSSLDTVLGTVTFDGNEAVYRAAVQVVQGGRLELLTRGTP